MPEQLSLSALAIPLRSVAHAAFKRVSRLRNERQAGQAPTGSIADLMENSLDETLDRMRGGPIEDSWWRGLLDRLRQSYIAPDFLRQPALQEWLREDQVADDLKALATARILGGAGDDPGIHARLAQSFANGTGEDCELARQPVEVVVAIIVAGYIAAIPTDQRPLAGMVQELSGQLQNRFDRLERTSLHTDPITQKAHTDQATQKLSEIIRLRSIDTPSARRSIQELLNRVSEGDLVATDNPTAEKVRYWAARLCAANAETLGFAKEVRSQLPQASDDINLRVLDALVAELEGDNDHAIRLIRDHDDPDSRTALFGLLSRTRGEQVALDWYAGQSRADDDQIFNDVGWKNWAICMVRTGNWKKTAQRLAALKIPLKNSPALALVEGMINASMLLPEEQREFALTGVPIFPNIVPNVGPEMEKHHARAKMCFELAKQSLSGIVDHNLARLISDWILWLRIVNPKTDTTQHIRKEISKGMKNGNRAVNLVLFTWAFEIQYDPAPLKQHLEQRKTLGDLSERELLAEFLLSEQYMPARDRIAYLDRHEGPLEKIISPSVLAGMHIEALLADDQIERARSILSTKRERIEKRHFDRLVVQIDAHDGHDPRSQLERLYRESHRLVDLQNLVHHLKQVDDRLALLPLVKKLFARQRTIENAQTVVTCFGDPGSYDHRAIIEFLEGNADLVGQSDELKAAMAWAYFRAGQFQDAKNLNDILQDQRKNQADFQLFINIAIASGDWERLSDVIDRTWHLRNSEDPETLMTVAYLAGQQDEYVDRAIGLAALAADKASGDPRILAAAYWLHFQLGRDAQANPDWLVRASELSSREEGPVWRIELPEWVAEFPKHRDHVNAVERQWLGGELPISLAVEKFSVSMARLLLHIPRSNEHRMDGRSRTILPIMAGNRSSVEMQSGWTVGLDVSSILVLSFLDLLESTIDSFHHVKLAPSAMEFLFREREQVRFHQPSRIEAAKQVRNLHDRKQIQVERNLIEPPITIVGQVGNELATLLQTAKHLDGKVICSLPILKAGSITQELADTHQYDDLIASTAEFCKLIHDQGKIDKKTYRRAASFLGTSGVTKQASLSASMLNLPIYLDRGALSNLQYTGILPSIASLGLDFRIHPDVLDDEYALIDEGEVGDYLVTKIEGIRRTLRNALNSGDASFLPSAKEQEDSSWSNDFRFRATASLLIGSSTCNALFYDDRYINSRSLATNPGGESVPIACVLDLLRFLSLQGRICVDDHWTLRHVLRRSGYAYVPLESDELVYWLKQVTVRNGHLSESVELRIIRQSIAHPDFLDMTSPTEAVGLTDSLMVAGRQAIVHFWQSENLPPTQAATLSDWVWHILKIPVLPSRRVMSVDERGDWIRETVSSCLACLLLPASIESQERRAHYSDWIENSVLQALRPANGDIIEKALEFVRGGISAVANDKPAYGHYFLAQLPAASRKVAIAQDPKFARQCGFEARRIFGLGPSTELADVELFAAAKTVLATEETTTVRDVAGNKVSISLDADHQHIMAKWSEQDVARQAWVPDLTILSPSQDARVDALRKIIDQIGPTATDFNYLLSQIETRELTDQEISAIFNESTNGVAAVHARLIHKIEHDSSLKVSDVIPESIAYFEKFSGPNPGTRDRESYFREVLIPYRKRLLDRNLPAGLDICCHGALHDDLSPGQWIAKVDNDAVWDALSSFDATKNPFWLLGALDVALYRQEDERFREFAANIIVALTHKGQGREDFADAYRLLQIFAAFVLNRINLLEGGPTKPGYWKRMSAWMHAGLITRSLAGVLSVPDEIDNFQQWTHNNMLAAGAYGDMVYASREPLLFAGRVPPLDLRLEVLARLEILRSRHEGEERQVPRSKEIENALARIAERGENIYLAFPGPLEGDNRPTQPLPEELSKNLGKSRDDDSDAFVLQSLVAVSRYFSLGEIELEYAREIVKSIAERIEDGDLGEHLSGLELASFIASVSQDMALRDQIVQAIVSTCSRISEEEHIQTVVRIVLQTSVECESQEHWFDWIEQTLADIATRLPSDRKQPLQSLLDCLNEMGVVLPANLWFHLRARSITLAGMA